MSEPIAERLSQFTPDGSALDRDALLFAAGRASVRPPRRWQALAGLLALSQALTLLLFLSVGMRSPRADNTPAVILEGTGAPESPSPERSEYWLLRRQALEGGSEPAPAPSVSLVPSAPSLRALSAPGDLLE